MCQPGAMRHTYVSHALILVILLLAALLRLYALGQEVRFHPDEAFFATFARNAAVHGDWLLPGQLDKTPFSIYAAAVSMHFTAAYVTDQDIIEVGLRAGEFAARLPNVFASILLIPLVGALVPARVRPLALLLAALSPYLIAFSATVFTDNLMLLFMVASLVAVQRGHPGWSGVLLALSITAKQQGVLYLPLLVALAYQRGDLSWRWLWRFMRPLLAGGGLLLLWDAARPETSVFLLASVNNTPERFLVTAEAVLPRLRLWLSYAGWMLGYGWLTALLVALAVAGWYRSKITGDGAQTDAKRRFDNPIPVVLCVYVLGYGLLHWLVAFNTYDRYLLPVVPLVIVLVAWGLGSLTRHKALILLPVLFIVVAMFPTAYQTSRAGIPIGRDGFPRQNDMIPLATYLNSKPLGAIIYDRWLGWELGYYLGAWTDKRRTYYPTPEAIAADAPRNPDPAPRYFVAPYDAPVQPWLSAMHGAGFHVLPDCATDDYVIYTFIPASVGASTAESFLPGHPAEHGDAVVFPDCADWLVSESPP